MLEMFSNWIVVMGCTTLKFYYNSLNCTLKWVNVMILNNTSMKALKSAFTE